MADPAPPAPAPAVAGSQAAAPLEAIPLSTKGLEPPARPGHGTVGKNVVVRANHFLVPVPVADNDVCHYDVSHILSLYDISLN